jgi:hypothetical protein
MTVLQRLSLVLRVLMEAGIVVALAFWGVDAGDGGVGSILLGVGVPAVGFGVWGAIDFRRATHGELLRLIQELAISGLAALAWYAAGEHALGLALACVSVCYHALVYASGEQLLKSRGKPAGGSMRQVSLRG